jgi:hypothetical protein
MNKSIAILASLVVLGSAASSLAAVVGVVNLSNYDTMFAVVGVGGAAVDAANTYVSLSYSVAGGPSALVQTTTGATQWTLDDGGYFDMSTGVMSTAAASTTVSFTLNAWTGSTSLADAKFVGTATWSQTTGSWDNAATPPATPASVVLQIPGTITLQAVPEPSTIALGLLGAGALLIRRRK